MAIEQLLAGGNIDMRIAISTDGFLTWGGGIDFIQNIIMGLQYEKKREIQIVLFTPNRENQYGTPLAKSFFDDVRLEQIFYESGDGGTDLIDKLHMHHIDVIFPLFDSRIHYQNFDIPYVSYVYDFQHKYLSHFFSEEEINKRNERFEKIISGSRNILVNSYDVKNDINKYYPANNAKIYVLPFIPICDENWITYQEEKECQKYFIVCNQFWKHKDHMTLFAAFEKLYQSGIANIKLICTGKMEDTRDTEYIHKLKANINSYMSKDNILFLGYIEKNKQIALLKNSIALVQPTLFEGGPGGGSVYNALALGVPCILSDIPINQEIDNNKYDVMYFAAGNADDLAEKMYRQIQRKKKEIDLSALRDNNCREYSEFLYSMLDMVINDFESKKQENEQG